MKQSLKEVAHWLGAGCEGCRGWIHPALHDYGTVLSAQKTPLGNPNGFGAAQSKAKSFSTPWLVHLLLKRGFFADKHRLASLISTSLRHDCPMQPITGS